MESTKRPCRVVVTGGPGGGKTTAIDLYRREIGESVVVVPEAATLLYSGGFPRIQEAAVCRATQEAIYQVQKSLELALASHFSGRVLLCDRGTVDGAAYWPGTPEDFFQHMGTTLSSELARYDAVIFFETAAVGGLQFESGNPIRNETLAQAVALDKKLRELWKVHPHFCLVPHQASFIKKINIGLLELSRVVAGQRG